MVEFDFYRGLKASYNAETDHKEMIYFATDTAEILMNGQAYGLSAEQLTNITNAINAAVKTVEFTAPGTIVFKDGEGNTVETVTLPVVTTDADGLMSSEDKAALDKVVSDLQDLVDSKNQPNGIAGLDENGKIDPSLVNGVVGHVLGVEDFVADEAALPASASEGQYYFVEATSKIALKTADGWEYSDPESGVLYNRRKEGEKANILYRWDGAAMAEVSASLTIGTVTGTAYDGGKGTALEASVEALSNNTINGKAISTNPVLTGDDIELTGYAKPATGGAVAAADDVNTAIGKLEANTEAVDAKVDALTEKVGMAADDPNNETGADTGIYKEINDRIADAVTEGGNVTEVINNIVDNTKTEILNQVIGGASEDYDSFEELEAIIKRIDGDTTIEGSFRAGDEATLTAAKEYARGLLVWHEA